ncbi:KIZ protein, partial [Penelope pileata]|nr:KIZ protein [Penelope pileata]
LSSSETRRLELERQLMEYKKSDAYLMKLKYVKLKKYLKETDERQKRALLRNQTLLQEFSQLEARVKTSSLEMIEKMEVRYGREIKSRLSLQEGDLSAQGDKEEECNEQVPWAARQAGIHAGTAVSRGLHHPAPFFAGCCTPAALSVQPEPSQTADCSCRQTASHGDKTDGHLPQASGEMQCANKPDERDEKADVPTGEKTPVTESSSRSSLPNFTEHKNPTELCSTSPNGGSAESGNAALASDTSGEEEVTREHLVASAEGCEQPILLTPSPELSISGPRHRLSSQLAVSRHSSSTHPAEDSSLQPPSSCAAEEELLGSSGYFPHLSSSLKEDLEVRETAVLCQLRGAGPGQLWDVGTLRASLSSHAAFLVQHQPLLTEELAAMFHGALESSEEVPGGQAPPLLREVLAEERGDRSSIQSNESSYSLPSIPSDGGEIKQAKHAPRLSGVGKQGCDIGNNTSKAKQEMCSERSSSSERSGDLSR